MTSLRTPPLFAALDGARRVLVAGAGGGFDVYAGLPLAVSLLDSGVDVQLANLPLIQRLSDEQFILNMDRMPAFHASSDRVT